MLENLFRDLRIGWRILGRERSFCALAVIVLAIGIGSVATQFAVVNGVVLHAFDFPGADRLVTARLVDPSLDRASPDFRMSSADFAEIRERQRSFDAFAGYMPAATINLTHAGQPRQYLGCYVTHDFFDTIGVSPALGREFFPEDDRTGATKAMIISDALWKNQFGADPLVIDRTVHVNGTIGVIVGVMPPGFSFPGNEDVWMPVRAEYPLLPRHEPNDAGLLVLARLERGVGIEQAEAEITAFARAFATEHPRSNGRFTEGYVMPLLHALTPPSLRSMLLTLLGFCVGVLLIACVNVMNMQFARATLRSRELAIRSSLGATRGRIVRQMLTESLALASIGAVCGVVLAIWATDFLDTAVHHGPNPLPSWMRFRVDGRVLLAVVSATVVAAVVSGFVPAWLSSRGSAVKVLKEGGRGNSSRSAMIISRGLVVFQILVTCVLLVGSLLQLQSLRNQQSVDHGYDTGAVLAARMGLMGGDYPSSRERQIFYEALLSELRASGQFESAALTNRWRMMRSGNAPVEIEGRSYVNDAERIVGNWENISPDYFATLGLRLLEGRDFTAIDSDQREPVAIVNALFARRHFGEESAVGRRFRTVDRSGNNPGPWRLIVGVAPTTRMQGLFEPGSDEAGFYVPYFAAATGPLASEPVAARFGTVVVRPRGDQSPEVLRATLQDVVNRVDPNLPLYFVETPRASFETLLSRNRFLGVMFSYFGAVAFVLAAVGLYGVMSFSVSQRTREFGVRMALGADRTQILMMVFRQAAAQLVIGVGLGIGVAVVVSLVGGESLANALIQISPRDPATYLAVVLMLTVVASLATALPAFRASRVPPMIALRAE